MEGLNSIQFAEPVRQLIEDVLVWIGFGTVVGLLAKAIMPGRDPGGAIVTLLLGIGGSVIGCGCASYFYQAERITPLSPVGTVVAVMGAFVILTFYKVLGGFWFTEGEGQPLAVRRRRRTYRYVTSGADD